jgi:hypothetical protein
MKTIDDREQLVTISGRLPWRVVRSTLHEPRRVEHSSTTHMKRVRLAVRNFTIELVIGLLVFVAFATSLTLFRTAVTSSSSWISWVSTCALPAFQLGIILVPVARFRRRHLVTLFARAGVCPACTHSLHGLPVESDGCTVCPECGAAWRVTAQDSQSSNASD